MGWQYLVVCLFDFVLGPIMNVVYATLSSTPLTPWVPLTIQGGGLYHLAMGAVVGVNSWGRTKEKLAVTESTTAIEEMNAGEDSQEPKPRRATK